MKEEIEEEEYEPCRDAQRLIIEVDPNNLWNRFLKWLKKHG